MFFETLSSLCKKNNTTVTALLAELKLSTSKGTAWRNGSIPSGTILIQLADRLGVSVDYLLGRETEAPQLDADERRLLEAFRSFNQEGREMLLRQAEIMAKSGDFKNKRDSSELGA